MEAFLNWLWEATPMLLLFAIFGIITYGAATDPLNRRDNPDGYAEDEYFGL